HFQTIIKVGASHQYTCTPQLACEEKYSYDGLRMISKKLSQHERELHARILKKSVSSFAGVAIGVDDDDTLHVYLKEGQ
ncbi:MAG: hypothetical protein GY822_28315, partial [Deltaproteobacteria bacterium]|nr:hypothetical protein [Deltaproteobacteria bacterium]